MNVGAVIDRRSCREKENSQDDIDDNYVELDGEINILWASVDDKVFTTTLIFIGEMPQETFYNQRLLVLRPLIPSGQASLASLTTTLSL